MNIVGLSAFFHESACCLLRDGRVVAAAEEERFSRVKHDPRLPASAFRFCLRAGGIGLTDDTLAFYESPRKKLSRQLWTGTPKGATPDLPWLDPGAPERAIREGLGWEGPILFFDHHLSHAASAFLLSDFPAAALLTADGVGEWATTSYGRGEGAEIELFEEVDFPHSLGLLYATLTSYLGFAVNDGEYKVMGLAPYGKPRHLTPCAGWSLRGPRGRSASISTISTSSAAGGCTRPPSLPCSANRRGNRRPGSPVSPGRREEPPGPAGGDPPRQGRLAPRADRLPDLCMAGGVALNVVANGRILREGPFERLFVQPAAGDSGGCLGAAALAHVKLRDKDPSRCVTSTSVRARPPRRSPACSPRRGSTPRTSAATSPSCWRRWWTGWSAARWSAGSTARWRSAPARSADAACSPIRAIRKCATGSIGWSRSAKPSAPSRQACWPPTPPRAST